MAAGRRTSLASLAGGTVEKVPGQNDPTLARLPLAKVVPTPLNPRTDFGGPDTLAELGESMRKRQLQPVVVIGRTSYLALFPEHTENVGTASHVVINGERRYRAARQVGFDNIETIIREEVATSRADVLDAVLSENIDRKNFDPIEEALAVATMVKECGKAVAAAARFRRSPGWVSQRLALLRLAPEVQVLVRSGKIPVRDARELAGHPEHEQMLVWRQTVRERTQDREERKAALTRGPKTAPRGEAAAAAESAAPGEPPAAGGGQRAEPQPVVLRSVPEQSSGEQSAPVPLPASSPVPERVGDAPEQPVDVWTDPEAMGERLVAHFGLAARKKIVVRLLEENEREAAGV